MNKKYLALLLAVSLGLVACGGSDSSDPIVETPDQSGEDSDEEASRHKLSIPTRIWK